ncbi:ABC transporter substrate-binding protein [Clostridia bacterium]|nr:ABC transporter substrate-binding protein [Clostridia bacterium]
MKKALAIALALAMMAMLFVGCSTDSGNTTDSSGNKTTDKVTDKPTSGGNTGDVVEIAVLFEGSNVTDDKGVIAAANEYLADKGLKIKPIWGTWGDFGEKATTAIDTGDSSIDIFFTCSWTDNNFAAYASKGAWVRLDDPADNLLDTYGKELKAALPGSLWDAFTVKGSTDVGIYGVPGYKDYSQLYTWDVNNTRLKELGIDFDSIKWSEDAFYSEAFANALKAAKEKYGESFYPLNFEPELPGRQIANLDVDATYLLSLAFDPKDPSKPEKLTVESRYESADYVKYLNRVREFYQAGYIDPQLTTSAQAASDGMANARKDGNYLIGTQTYSYGFDVTASTERKIDAKFPAMSKAIISTGSAQGAGYAISAYSKHKAEAVKFLNLWYTDSKLANILAYGVEGTNYTLKDGLIDFGVAADPDKGIEADEIGKGHAAYLPWRNGMGNIFVLTPSTAEGADYFKEFKAYNEEGVAVSTLGFTFDSEPVKTKLAALSNIEKEYSLSLNLGSADVATKLPEFVNKLKDNGIGDVVEEYQKQLDAFLATK